MAGGTMLAVGARIALDITGTLGVRRTDRTHGGTAKMWSCGACRSLYVILNKGTERLPSTFSRPVRAIVNQVMHRVLRRAYEVLVCRSSQYRRALTNTVKAHTVVPREAHHRLFGRSPGQSVESFHSPVFAIDVDERYIHNGRADVPIGTFCQFPLALHSITHCSCDPCLCFVSLWRT